MTVKQSLDSMELMRSIIRSNSHTKEADAMIDHILDLMKDEEPDLWNGKLTKEEADRIWDHLMEVSEQLRLELIAWRAAS